MRNMRTFANYLLKEYGKHTRINTSLIKSVNSFSKPSEISPAVLSNAKAEQCVDALVYLYKCTKESNPDVAFLIKTKFKKTTYSILFNE